tara:strand:- start:46765 stop:47043 length:279 start_codon:yes stop_codon:yes gene_type:complete
MKVKDFVGSEAIHDSYGLVFVDSAPARSKTQVDITVLQRGKGWNEATEQYRRYFVGSYLQKDGSRSLRWAFTNTDEYGIKDQVHINTLIPKF